MPSQAKIHRSQWKTQMKVYQSMSATPIHRLLALRANQRPEAVAILAPNRSPLTYGRLLRQIEWVVQRLNAAGLRRGDRIAIVLPNGPEMAVAFLGVASVATSAPLNPSYRAEEFDFYLEDLKAKALVVQRGTNSPAIAVAKARGVALIELDPVLSAEAGVFTLNGDGLTGGDGAEFAEADDTALVLHTSGTTSRPKIVPLTHTNLCVSAGNVAISLALTESDLCLNVMPLFHIHGLVAATLASLFAGGSVVCTPGFDAPCFFEWIDTFRPSWYTAVPTMHQAVLAQASRNPEIVARRRLRFIRSSSAALPPQVMMELEKSFRAPVIEAYGMTEAAHQMASNPLPPRPRKPGSVGLAAGPEVAIMDEAGNFLPAGTIGEVVIRGRNVSKGYENNPTANATAFTDGWFRTGDQGVMDGEGYLSLTGRLKEIINRGGEKISPREIDEALLNHPGVRQAVAFSVRHPTLGEDVAAAVVKKDGQTLNEQELREFALLHLPGFKVPSRFVIVSEIPKGPTGKVQRIGLADRLAQDLSVPYEPPTERFELLAAATFEQILNLDRVGRNDNFFTLGGDSIRATQVVARLMNALGLEIPPATLFRRPTPALLGVELARLQEEREIDALAEQLRKLPPQEVTRLLDEGIGGKA
jgi:acyl-CoA synthetase (AMP-forming)/AMP-acid ligase II/acyl carrier protein